MTTIILLVNYYHDSGLAITITLIGKETGKRKPFNIASHLAINPDMDRAGKNENKMLPIISAE